MHSPVEDQRRALAVHAAMSSASGKPMVVHVRDAWDDVFEVLDGAGAERVVIHCFSGTSATAEACAARGWWMSFAGNVTYPKNEHLRVAAAAVPADLLLVETDSPYLSPQPRRGRDNAPEHVVMTIDALANVRGEAVDDVRERTAANARTAFPGLR
jgi:TatD DNase family protein